MMNREYMKQTYADNLTAWREYRAQIAQDAETLCEIVQKHRFNDGTPEQAAQELAQTIGKESACVIIASAAEKQKSIIPVVSTKRKGRNNMKIEKRGTMPNGDSIQLENWIPTYPDLMNPHTVAVYMVSRYTLPGAFAPKAGQLFRCAFTFPAADAARTVYEALRTGTAQPADYLDYLYYPQHAPCVTGKGA